MKSNARIKKLILITFGIVFALSPIITTNFSFISGNSNKSSNYSEDINLDNKNPQISGVSGKIHIDNNWTAAKSAGICRGNGNYSEPYVIEDLVIDGGGSGSCILIENSDVYFKIENCTAYNSGGLQNAGIKLNNITNSQLIDNICSINTDGIFLYNSDNNTISENIANNNGGFGIFLDESNNNDISGNTANNNQYWTGISISRGDNNTVSGNTANNNQYGIGISISRSDNNTVSGNTANNNRYGIRIQNSDYNTVSGNIANNTYFEKEGISMLESNNNDISGNTANNNQYGIRIQSSDYNTISGNIANNSYYGIFLYFSNYNTISGNNAYNNDYGIFLYISNYNTISGNTLMGNSKCIIEEYCEGNIFKDNGYCVYGEIPIKLIILISVISGWAVIGVATLLLLIRKRKRIEDKPNNVYLNNLKV